MVTLIKDILISNMMVPVTLRITAIISQKKKVLRFDQYLKLPIDAHRVITIFELSGIYLMGPTKKIFRKFPKMDFLNFFLILSPKFYYIELAQLAKHTVLGYV